MTDSERIKAILKYTNLKPHPFALKIGYKRSTAIYAVESGGRPFSKKIATDICKAYPEISNAWILTGEGDMLKIGTETLVDINNDQIKADIIEKQNQRILKLEKEVSNANETIHNLGALLVDAHKEITRLKSIDDHESFLKRGKRQIKTR